MKLTTIERKRYRVRNKLRNSSKNKRYRLSVSRSTRNISAQIIDDVKGETLVSGSTLVQEIKKDLSASASKKDVAKLVGGLVGKRAAKAGIGSVVFDRGGYLYHGRIKALAESARANGLNF